MNKKGFIGITPLLFFLLFFIGASIICGDFSKVPIVTAFFFASIIAVALTKGLSLPDRVRIYGRGAGTTKMMFMIWIFFCAGAFAKSAEAMGCINETVNCILTLLPPNCIFASIFIAGCFISMATGSGIGSIVALGPIAVGVANATGANMSMMCALVVCGAIFGDNLSFISDTTIIATSTQGCQMRDKFLVNSWIAVPAALVTIGIYLFLGKDMESYEITETVDYIKILPYVLVIIMAVAGVDILVLLLIGTAICGIMGMAYGMFDFYGWLEAIKQGIFSMSELTVIVLMAAGLMALITHNGGMEYLISKCMRIIHGRRSAEFAIALLSAVTCLCTSNNTIAIITVAPAVKEISQKFGIDPRKAASLMDTASCISLELIPYSTHLLAAAALGSVASATLIPFVYYPFALLLFTIIAIVFNIPRLTTKAADQQA